MMIHKTRTQQAIDTPFDNTGTDFESTNVQDALEEVGVSASPGFSWGRSGNVGANSWLSNEGVPSNTTGRYIFVNDPILFSIFVSNEEISTFTIGVYTHDGAEVNLELKDTLVITSARGGTKITNIPLINGKQLAVRLISGSAKNVVAGVIIKGSA